MSNQSLLVDNILQSSEEIISRPIILSLEGNIGSGKSTFLNILKTSLDIKYIPEGVAEWQNIQGKGINLLDLLYKNPKRWSYTFQTFAFLTRLKQWSNEIPKIQGSVCISERSLFSDKYIFATHQKEYGSFQYEEWHLYLEYFEYLKKFSHPVDGFIYLNTDPEKCLERIQKRGREEEKGLQLEFLQQINDCHEKWLKTDDLTSLPAPVLEIDTGKEFENDLEYQNEIVVQVSNFIQRLKKNKK